MIQLYSLRAARGPVTDKMELPAAMLDPGCIDTRPYPPITAAGVSYLGAASTLSNFHCIPSHASHGPRVATRSRHADNRYS